jgi:hypothetical protein
MPFEKLSQTQTPWHHNLSPSILNARDECFAAEISRVRELRFSILRHLDLINVVRYEGLAAQVCLRKEQLFTHSFESDKAMLKLRLSSAYGRFGNVTDKI